MPVRKKFKKRGHFKKAKQSEDTTKDSISSPPEVHPCANQDTPEDPPVQDPPDHSGIDAPHNESVPVDATDDFLDELEASMPSVLTDDLANFIIENLNDDQCLQNLDINLEYLSKTDQTKEEETAIAGPTMASPESNSNSGQRSPTSTDTMNEEDQNSDQDQLIKNDNPNAVGHELSIANQACLELLLVPKGDVNFGQDLLDDFSRYLAQRLQKENDPKLNQIQKVNLSLWSSKS